MGVRGEMTKRFLSAVMAMSLSAVIFTGCAANSAQPQTEAGTTAASSQADTTAPASQAGTEAKAEAKTKSGTVTVNVDLSKQENGKAARLWLPVPKSDEHQKIEDVKYEAKDAKTEVTEDSLGNKILYVEWAQDTDAAERLATLSFKVTRTEILRPELVEKGEVGADMAEYLKASSTVPVDGQVKELADTIVKGQTTVLGKARAIYDWVIANMNRDESVIGCGLGKVEELLSSKLGKCTDINSVFIGLCRSEGIPAREMFGIRINDKNITKNQHCWSEFYLPGTGWVAADPADVLKAILKNKWDKSSDEAKKMQEYYWGNNDEKRVELSRGRDIVLNPKQDGEALNNFGYPYAEVGGQKIDFYQPDTFIYTYSFEEAN